MAAMKIAATELMAETTNSDGSFQGFAPRALSVPRPLSLLRQIPLSLPPYAGLSCPEHEGRLPLTLTALVSGRGRTADTDADARVGGRRGTDEAEPELVGRPPSPSLAAAVIKAVRPSRRVRRRVRRAKLYE